MKTNLLLIIVFLLSICKVSSQEEKQLANRDGINVTYQLILEEKGKKKDKYILIVNAVNTSDENLYYSIQLSKDEEGNWFIPSDSEKGFTKIKVRNSTGLFGNGQSIRGDKTDDITTNDKILFEIKRDNIYTRETTFKVKPGEKPLITNTFIKTLKKIEDFDFKVSSKMLNGNYISSCGDLKINISFEDSPERGNYLRQTTIGKQFIWIRSSETTFIRENSTDYSLTFNKKDNTFTYSTSDGIVCTWKRE